MKKSLKLKAIQLRKKGRSYGEISKEIGVVKSTLSLWLRDISLSSGQKGRLYTKQKDTRKITCIMERLKRGYQRGLICVIGHLVELRDVAPQTRLVQKEWKSLKSVSRPINL